MDVKCKGCGLDVWNGLPLPLRDGLCANCRDVWARHRRVFNLIWEEAENASRVDTLGGMEYRRVRAAWLAAGVPHVAEAEAAELARWIIREANTAPKFINGG